MQLSLNTLSLAMAASRGVIRADDGAGLPDAADLARLTAAQASFPAPGEAPDPLSLRAPDAITCLITPRDVPIHMMSSDLKSALTLASGSRYFTACRSGPID